MALLYKKNQKKTSLFGQLGTVPNCPTCSIWDTPKILTTSNRKK